MIFILMKRKTLIFKFLNTVTLNEWGLYVSGDKIAQFCDHDMKHIHVSKQYIDKLSAQHSSD